MTEKEFRQNLIIGIPNVPPIDNIKIQAKPVVDNKIETNNEVERALEELKHLLEMIGESWSATTQQFKASWFDTLKSNAQNLVAALEAEKNLKSKQRIAELEQIIKSYKIASFIVPDKWIKELEELQKNMPKPEPEIFVDEGKVGEDFTAKAKVSKDENGKLTIHEIVIEEPKIDIMKNQIFNQDCMEGMKKYPDKYFDLAIVDPPYFSGPEKKKFYGAEISSCGAKRVEYKPLSESWEVPSQEYYDELCRVSKHQIIWGTNYFHFKQPVGRIIWDKVNDKSNFSNCEIASCSLIKSVRIFRFMWNGMFQGKSIEDGSIQQGNKKLNEKRIHPTQKPVALYKWLLTKYAKAGQKILDTHLGSGSSRIAAYELGFDFIGFELNKDYFEAAEKRFQDFKNNNLISDIYDE